MKNRRLPHKSPLQNISKSTNKSPTNQVRIIGGQHRRRLIHFIDADGLRPTPDRLRETLFNWLTGYLNEARVLDVCAGSGVLGLETLSRGAAHVTLIELNAHQAKQLQQSVDMLGMAAQTCIIHADAAAAIATLTDAYDVIFLDPPYAANLWQILMDKLLAHKLLHNDTRLYFESDKPIDTVLDANTLAKFEILKDVKVGQAYAYLLTPSTW